MGRPLGPPCAYGHPLRGVLIPDTLWGPVPTPKGLVSGSFSFSYRMVSLRLPGSYTNPQGVGTGPLRGPVILRLMCVHVCTRVRTIFGHFDCKLSHFVRVHLGQNCRLVSFSTGTLRGLLTPSGHTFGVINQPPLGGWLKKNNKFLIRPKL